MAENNENSSKISDRIAKIRVNLCNNNNYLFAAKIDKSIQYASALCTGASKPGKKMMEEILSAFPEVSRAWLFFGEGNMLEADNSTQYGKIGENTGIIVQHGGGGDTYNNQINSELMQIVKSQQQTIQELTEQNKILTQIIKEKI